MDLRFSSFFVAGSAVLLGASCSHPIGDPSDGSSGFGSGGFAGDAVSTVGFSSASGVGGSNTPPQYECPTPETFHAVVLRNGATLRSDADGPDGALDDSTWSVTGVVVESGMAALRVDACGVTPCDPAEVYEIIPSPIAGGGLGAVPVGAFVEITYETRAATSEVGASYSISIANVPMLEGATNPVDSSSAVWFAGMHGIVGDAPFVPTTSLGWTCYFLAGVPEGHDLIVHDANDPAKKLQVPMGATEAWTVDAAPNAGAYDVTNLTSTLDYGPVAALDFYAVRTPI